jgi:hypothetical protein
LASPIRLAIVWKRFITEAYLPDARSPTQARQKQERERDPSTIPFTRKEAMTGRKEATTERKQETQPTEKEVTDRERSNRQRNKQPTEKQQPIEKQAQPTEEKKKKGYRWRLYI